MDDHIRLGHPFEPPATGIVLPIQANTAKVVRIILDIEPAIGIFHAPFMIGHAGTLVHLVRQFLVADGDLYARISEGGRLFRPYPKISTMS